MQVFILLRCSFMRSTACASSILDMWPALHRFHREAMWVQWAIFIPTFALPALLIITGAKV